MTRKNGDSPSVKKALFLCPSPYGIGTYHRAIAFAREFVAAGYQVDLLCTEQESVLQKKRELGSSAALIDGVNVVQTPLWGLNPIPLRGWNLGELINRLSYLRGQSGRYDLVYSFEYQPNVLALAFPLAKLHGAVHVNDWCDWYAGRHHKMKGIRLLQDIDSWAEEFPRKHVDCVTTICQSIYDRALKSGVPEKKLLMVREGADFPFQMESRKAARAALGIEEGEFWIVAMVDQDTSVLQNAIENLKRQRPEARLALIGQTHAPVPDAHTPGRVSDQVLHHWLCAADCAWLPLEDTPLNRGRLPHKIGHFRMYGLPLVTTPVSDVPELEDPGIILADFSGESFAKATRGMSALSDESRKKSQSEALPVFEWKKLIAPILVRVNELFGTR